MRRSLRWLVAAVAMCGVELVIALVFGSAALAALTGTTALLVVLAAVAAAVLVVQARRLRSLEPPP